MTVHTLAAPAAAPSHRVRELICAYRPLRDAEGRLVGTSTRTLNAPSMAATALTPLIADQVVEVFGVACLSTRFRLLAWHLLSRGTRTSTPVSLPDVFVPACLTPGTTGLIVVHNHPSGDPTPSWDDMALTRRLQAAGAILDLPLLDHLIVGDGDRYFSFREAGHIDARTAWPVTPGRRSPPAITSRDRTAPLGPVKPRRTAPTPWGLSGLTGACASPALALT